MLKKSFAILLITVLVFALFAGCGTEKPANENQSSQATTEGTSKDTAEATTGKAQPPADPDKPVTIELYTHSYEAMTTVLKQLIEEYKKVSPNVTVNYNIIPDDQFFTKLPILLSTKQPVDIINIHNSHLAKYLNLMSKAPDYVVEDIKTNAPSSYNMSLINGELYGYTYPDLHMLYVNKKMFKDAGLEYPKTWQDVVNINKQMSKKITIEGVENQSLGINLWAGAGGHLFHVPEFKNILDGLGGAMFTEDGKLNLSNNAKAVEALEIFKSLVYTQGDYYTGFSQGYYGMLLGCRWVVPYLQQYGSKDLDFEIIPPPAGPDGKPLGQGYFQMQVVPNYRPQENQDAAWKFLHWLHNDENNYILEKVGGFGDWRLNTAERFAAENPVVGSAFDMAPYASKAVVNENYQVIERVLGEWIEKFVNGSVSAEEALSGAQAEVEKNINK